MRTVISTTVTSKGQTTLPKAVRLALGVCAGDRVCFVVDDNEIRLLPMRPVGRLFGTLKPHGPSKPLEDMERGIAEGACDSAAASLPSDQASTSSVDRTGAVPVRGLTDVPNA